MENGDWPTAKAEEEVDPVLATAFVINKGPKVWEADSEEGFTASHLFLL